MPHTQRHPQMALPPAKLPYFSVGVTILVLFLVIATSIGLLWWQQPLLTQSTDPRSEASQANGAVLLTTNPAANSTLTIGQPAKIDVNLNTQGQTARDIELVFHVITGATDTLNLTTYTTQNLEVTQQEIEATSDGFLILYKAKPANNATFTSTTGLPILSINFTPTKSGTVKLAFDTERSKVIKINSAAPEDILRTVGTLEFLIKANPDQLAKSCNEPCNSNTECAVNHMCFEKKCRLVTNVSSQTCAAPANATTGASCNQACGSNSDCRAGLTCHESKCRRPENPDSASCALSSAQNQANIAANCNAYCTDNRGCAANLRCFENRCRLATNVSSTSCSALTQPTVSGQYYPSATATPAPPKGGLVSPSPVSTRSATPRPATMTGVLVSPSPVATISASPLSSPYVMPSPMAEVPVDDLVDGDWLASLRNLLLNLPMGAGSIILVVMVIGLLLLVLAILLMLARRGRGGDGPGPKGDAPTDNSYEQQLQSKINELRQKTGPVATPTPPVTEATVSRPAAPVAAPSDVPGKNDGPPKPTLQSNSTLAPMAAAATVAATTAALNKPAMAAPPAKPVTPPAPSNPAVKPMAPAPAAPTQPQPHQPPPKPSTSVAQSASTRPPAPVTLVQNAPQPAKPTPGAQAPAASTKPANKPNQPPKPNKPRNKPEPKGKPRPVFTVPKNGQEIAQSAQRVAVAKGPVKPGVAAGKPNASFAQSPKPAALPPKPPQAALPAQPPEKALPAEATKPTPQTPALNSSSMMQRLKSRGVNLNIAPSNPNRPTNDV